VSDQSASAERSDVASSVARLTELQILQLVCDDPEPKAAKNLVELFSAIVFLTVEVES
jgi:hypothetical protein